MFRPEALMVVGYSLFGLSWLLPNHYNPWLNFHSEALAFLAIAVLAAGVLVAHSGNTARFPALAGFLLGITALPWFQWFLGVSLFAGDAWLGTYFLSGWALAVILGFNVARKEADRWLLCLMHTLWIAALVSAMIGFVQWLKLEPALGIYVWQTDATAPPMGNMGQPNQLSTLLLMGMVAYGYVYERRVIGRLAFFLGVFFMSWVLVTAHSRAGILGVLAISGVFLVKHTRIASRIGKLQIAGWVLALSVGYFVAPWIDRALLLNVAQEELFSAGGRGLIWTQTIEGIVQSPWVGYGWNQTSTAQLAGVVAHPGTVFFSYAHNALLDLLAWNGVPLGLLLISVGVYWFCTRLSRVTGLAGSYAMIALLPFGIHSMVEFPFAYAYFLVAAGLLMGVAEASIGPVRSWHANRLLGGVALALWAAVGVVMVYEYFLIEEDYRVARFESFGVGVTDPAYEVPKLRLFTQMAAMLKATRQRVVPGMTAQQLDDLGRTALRFPQGGIIFRYAMALGLNGDSAGALHWMAILRGLFGEEFYRRAKDAWSENAAKFPELKMISLP